MDTVEENVKRARHLSHYVCLFVLSLSTDMMADCKDIWLKSGSSQDQQGPALAMSSVLHALLDVELSVEAAAVCV